MCLPFILSLSIVYQFYQNFAARKEVEEGVSFRLVREPRNQMDRSAIAVYLDADQAGYVTKGIASKLAPFIDSGQLTLTAKCGKSETILICL